uniref:BTB domain-containing protein n=1 Tax=Panagrolaimus superbus TaxID=310955 RepID=A0A914YHF0_9BILA
MAISINEKESLMPLTSPITDDNDAATSTSIDDDDDGSSLKDILQALYDSDKYKDLTFIVAKKEIHANELLVKIRSSVLKEKIEDPKREVPNGKIMLDDQNFEDFKKFLKFLYTNDCEITQQNLTGLFLLGKKYNVPFLCNKCLNIFNKFLNKNNASTFAAAALKNPDLAEMFQKCLELVPNVMESMSFFYVDKYGKVENVVAASFIQQILRQSRSENAEDALFAKIYEWAKYDCRHRGLKEESNNIKETMKDLLPYIRFGNLKPYTLATIVRSNNLLPLEELVSYLCNVAVKENQPDENSNV